MTPTKLVLQSYKMILNKLNQPTPFARVKSMPYIRNYWLHPIQQ